VGSGASGRKKIANTIIIMMIRRRRRRRRPASSTNVVDGLRTDAACLREADPSALRAVEGDE
jgi:hypothetical protein